MTEETLAKSYEEVRTDWLIQYNRRKAKKWYQYNKEGKTTIV